MVRRLGLFCMALAMFSIAGGHWTVLQMVAWSEMLHDYTHSSGSFAVAVEQTFDGQHHCALCRQIESAKARERGGNSALPNMQDIVKMKATLAESRQGLLPRMGRVGSYPRGYTLRVVSRTEAPPTPPPRGLRLA